MSPNVSIRLLAAQSDGRLLDLVSRGNERAFEALVSRYRAPLLRYCARLGLGDALAEDVVQHSLLKAWLALTGGTTVRAVRPWLYRIVHNLAISSIRVTHEQPGVLPETLEQGAIGSTPAGAEDRLAAREALGHVAALPEMQRHAIVLTAIEGRSHEEAASVMGITDGAVRGLVHRARASIRTAAAAVMPPGLHSWLSRGTEALPLADRSGEISAGAGVLGLTGILTKGVLVAATAGLVIAGGSAVQGRHHGRPHHIASHSAAVAGTVTPAAMDIAPSGSSSTRSALRAESRGNGRGGGDAGRHSGSKGSSRHGTTALPTTQTTVQSQSSDGAAGQDRHSSGRGDGSTGGRQEGHHGSGRSEGSGTSGSGDSGRGSGDSETGQASGSGGGGSSASSDGGSSGGDSGSGGSGSGGSSGDSGSEVTQASSGHDGSGSGGGGADQTSGDSSPKSTTEHT